MRAATQNIYAERIEAVVGHILDHLDDELTPEELARIAGFSRFHFSRIFSGMMGEKLFDFIRRLRLERAAYRLGATPQAITEIAFDAGYATHEAFTKAFRDLYRLAPSEFRRLKVPHLTQCVNGVHFRPVHLPPAPTYTHPEIYTMNVEVREVQPLRVIAMRHIGPYHEIGDVFGRLHAWAAQKGVPMQGAIGIWYDDPETTPAPQLRSDAGLVVPAEYSIVDPDVHLVEIPGGTYAVCAYRGPYEGLGDEWSRFMGQWFPSSGYQMDEEPWCFEWYVDDCSVVPPEQCLTELYQRIKTSVGSNPTT